MSRSKEFYSLSYLISETKKVLENYQSLEKTALGLKEKTLKSNDNLTREAYDRYFDISEMKFQEIKIAHIKCDEMNDLINNIRTSLDSMKETFEDVRKHLNEKSISSLKNITGNIVKRDYDVEGNEYVQEILNNNATIAQNEKTPDKGGKKMKKNEKTKRLLVKKNKSKKSNQSKRSNK
jgi:chemotaxis regulatin CheY-phosphate phosphatase CheZ